MIGKDEVIIDEEFIDNYNNKKNLPLKEEQIINENEANNNNNENEIDEDNQIKENQTKSEEDKNIENINETENIININNNNNNNIDDNNASTNQLPFIEKEGENNIYKQILSRKESATHRYSTNQMDDISFIPTTKEESTQQKMETNIHNKLANFNELNTISQNVNLNETNKNIIDENEESKGLDHILNKDIFYNQRNSNNNNIYNNIFNNKNRLYFTEADLPGIKLNNKMKKCNSSLSYVVAPIQGKTPDKIQVKQKQSETQKHLRKELNRKLNNLSPGEYMKKKFVNKFNFHPLQYRIKKIEEEIEKQNKYDFEKAMKEFKIKYDKEQKCKENKKHIFELHKQFDKKLKNMGEKRENLYNEKIQKILQKQKIMNTNKRRKNINNSYINNADSNKKNEIMSTNKLTDRINSYITADDKYGKLPLINNLPRHELVKILKEKNEEEFCNNTIKRLKENEMIHRKNYLNQLNILNKKLLQNNKIYKERSAKCLLATKSRDIELEEDYMEKDMIKRYNIKQIILREKSARKDKIKENMAKNFEGVKEKKEIIKKEEKEKIDKIIKRLNREYIKENLDNVNEHNLREYYANLQKENLRRYTKDINDYYNEIILRQGDNLLIANEIDKEGPFIKQAILKRTLKEQNKKNQKLKNMEIHLSKMDKENINNKDEDTKRKIMEKKRRIELEKLEKEKEEHY